VKDKNSMFTVLDEDMIFSKRKNHWCLYNKLKLSNLDELDLLLRKMLWLMASFGLCSEWFEFKPWPGVSAFFS